MDNVKSTQSEFKFYYKVEKEVYGPYTERKMQEWYGHNMLPPDLEISMRKSSSEAHETTLQELIDINGKTAPFSRFVPHIKEQAAAVDEKHKDDEKAVNDVRDGIARLKSSFDLPDDSPQENPSSSNQQKSGNSESNGRAPGDKKKTRVKMLRDEASPTRIEPQQSALDDKPESNSAPASNCTSLGRGHQKEKTA